MKRTYDKDQFIWEVTNEAVMLRQHATKEERERLCLQLLDPVSKWNCIYGLTTGDCFSERATELIAACCPRFFYPGAIRRGNEFNDVAAYANGTDALEFKRHRNVDVSLPRLFSAIEAYVILDQAKNANLVAYLRGETKTLDLYID